MDEDTCMVDIAKFYMEFICEESCGKCSPCRIGTHRLLQMLDDITKGNATIEELDKIEELAAHMKVSCLWPSARPHPTRSLPPFAISARNTRIISLTRDVQRRSAKTSCTIRSIPTSAKAARSVPETALWALSAARSKSLTISISIPASSAACASRTVSSTLCIWNKEG